MYVYLYVCRTHVQTTKKYAYTYYVYTYYVYTHTQKHTHTHTRAHITRAHTQAGNTPLLLALWGGHKEIVKMLLDKGATVHIQNRAGNYPIMWAAKHEDPALGISFVCLWVCDLYLV